MRDETHTRADYVHRRVVNLRVKLAGPDGDAPGPRGAVGAFVDRFARRIGRKAWPDPAPRAYPSWLAVRPENAFEALRRELDPDIVIVNSIDLPAWRQIRADLRRRGVPVALYLREETGLLHISHSNLPPDLLLSNAEGHASAAADLGIEAIVVPSVVDCRAVRVESSRERVLYVNPIPEQGLEIALALAHARPDIPFLFVESWPLEAAAYDALVARLTTLPNVELLRFVTDPRRLYEQTRLLLAPYMYPGRSRVVAEAHCNGIPVLASTGYGLVEAVGQGGIVEDPHGPLDPWVAALASLWDDADAYERYVAAARECAARPELQPDTVVATLEGALAKVVRR
jgi:glycosyltransferase involved in cell wall biosynthesis